MPIVEALYTSVKRQMVGFLTLKDIYQRNNVYDAGMVLESGKVIYLKGQESVFRPYFDNYRLSRMPYPRSYERQTLEVLDVSANGQILKQSFSHQMMLPGNKRISAHMQMGDQDVILMSRDQALHAFVLTDEDLVDVGFKKGTEHMDYAILPGSYFNAERVKIDPNSMMIYMPAYFYGIQALELDLKR